MKRHLLRLGSAALMLTVLSSCGGGGTNTASQEPVATAIYGIASKGPVQNGDVTVWKLNEDGTKGEVLKEGVVTSSDGSYVAEIGKYNGNIMVEVTGGTYQDEATGTTTSLSIPLRAALTGARGNITLAVTPLTELAVRKAGDKLTKTAIEDANALVGLMAGGISVSGTNPIDVSKGWGRRVDDNQYGLMLAAFSQMSLKKGWTLDRVIEYIKDDLADDGVAQNAAADLKASLQEFMSGTKNKSGITDLSEVNIDNGLDLVSDPQQPVLPPGDSSSLDKAKAFITEFRNAVSSFSSYNGVNSVDLLETPFNRLSEEMSGKIEPMLASVNHRVVWIVRSYAAFLNNGSWSGKDGAGNTLKIQATDSGTANFTVTSPSGATLDSGTLTLAVDALGNPASGRFTGVIKGSGGDINVDIDFTGTLKNNTYESITFTGALSASGVAIDFRDSGRKMTATLSPDPDNVSGYDDVYPTSAYLSARITTETASLEGTLSLPEIVWSSTEDLVKDPATGANVCVGGPVPKQARFDGSFAEMENGKETGLKLIGAFSAKFHNAETFNNCALESEENFESWTAQFDGSLEAPSRPAFMAFLKAEERQKDVTEVSVKYTRRDTDGRIVYLSGSGQLFSDSTKSQRFTFKEQNGLDLSVDYNGNMTCESKFSGSIKAPGGEKLAELYTLDQTCVPAVKYTDGYFESII